AVGDDPGRDYQTLLRAVSRLDLDLRIKTAQPLVPDESSSARVGMIRDHLSPVDFRALYAACDFVVVPLVPHTRNASGVSSFLEAGAMGKAAIVTDSDGIRDYIKPNDTCLVVPPGDPEALAAAIARLRNEPDTCR